MRRARIWVGCAVMSMAGGAAAGVPPDATTAQANLDALTPGTGTDAGTGTGTGTGTADTTPFSSVELLGTASLVSGDLTAEGGGTLAAGGVGFAAQTTHLTLIGAFTFGSDATGGPVTTVDDYVRFLHVPAGALGGELYARAAWPRCGVWLGASLGLRAGHRDFGFADGRTESINTIGVDPALSLAVPLAPARKIFFVAEVGLAMRFWNKPGPDFIAALGVDAREHAYFGPRALVGMNLGPIHVGVEVMRLWGGGLESLEELAIIPWVGFRGGLAPAAEAPPATSCRARDAAVAVPRPPPPPPRL